MPQRHTQPLSRNPAPSAVRGTADARGRTLEVASRPLPGERLTVHGAGAEARRRVSGPASATPEPCSAIRIEPADAGYAPCVHPNTRHRR